MKHKWIKTPWFTLAELRDWGDNANGWLIERCDNCGLLRDRSLNIGNFGGWNYLNDSADANCAERIMRRALK
jgi:hypothetical protein